MVSLRSSAAVAVLVTAALSALLVGVLPRVALTVDPLRAAGFCDSVSEIPPSECQALTDLFSSTNGPTWVHRDNWIVTNTPCSWYGVTCSSGHVTAIDLPRNGVSGPIPSSIGNLTELERLELTSNPLTGSIPPELGSLAKLTTLYLEANYLTGNIPPELGNLSSLRSLRLSNCEVGGSIPPELGNLTNLEGLYVYFTQLSGTIPPQLGNLVNLRTLKLSKNQLSGTIPPELGQLTNLWYLDLSFNQLTGEIPPELGALREMQLLVLGYNQLSGTIPPALADLPDLRDFIVSSNLVAGNVPPALGQRTGLRRLYLDGTHLSGALPGSLVGLATLERLWFDNTSLCEPPDTAYQTWLSGIPDLRRTGTLCQGLPYAVTGRVSYGTVPVSGVSVSAGGSYSTTTDATGWYTMTVPASGAYTLVPSRTSYTFTPSSRWVSIPPDQVADFTAVPLTCTISGRVADSQGTGIQGVNLSSGSAYSATTNATGHYTITGVLSGTYTLTPSKDGYSFSPTTRQVTLPPNQTGQDFTGSALTPGVLELVDPLSLRTETGNWPPGVGQKIIAHIRVRNGGDLPLHVEHLGVRGRRNGTEFWDIGFWTVDLAGHQEWTLDPNNERPLEAGSYSFRISYSLDGATWQEIGNEINFTVTSPPPPTYSISGRVVDGSNNGIPGVTISNGKGNTATTDSSGNYTLSGVPSGTYPITPSNVSFVQLEPDLRNRLEM